LIKDKRLRNSFSEIKEIIDRNAASNGWLIFSTHDIIKNCSPYGCPPKDFEKIVRYAVESRAHVLPVEQVCKALNIPLLS